MKVEIEVPSREEMINGLVAEYVAYLQVRTCQSYEVIDLLAASYRESVVRLDDQELIKRHLRRSPFMSIKL